MPGPEVGVREPGDLRQMGYADHLVMLRINAGAIFYYINNKMIFFNIRNYIVNNFSCI